MPTKPGEFLSLSLRPIMREIMARKLYHMCQPIIYIAGNIMNKPFHVLILYSSFQAFWKFIYLFYLTDIILLLNRYFFLLQLLVWRLLQDGQHGRNQDWPAATLHHWGTPLPGPSTSTSSVCWKWPQRAERGAPQHCLEAWGHGDLPVLQGNCLPPGRKIAPASPSTWEQNFFLVHVKDYYASPWGHFRVNLVVL